jgi:hypothetical protein
LKAGIDLSLLISLPLLSVHVSRRYHPDHCSVLPEGERDVQQAVLSCLSQRIKSRLRDDPTGADEAERAILKIENEYAAKLAA